MVCFGYIIVNTLHKGDNNNNNNNTIIRKEIKEGEVTTYVKAQNGILQEP
jgi:hypothetical protein